MLYVTLIEQISKEEGREERRSLALKMLQENIPIETIARITEWTIAELQQLQVEQPQD